MTMSISKEQRRRAVDGLQPDQPAGRSRRTPMVRWLRTAAVVSGLAGVSASTIEIVTVEYLHLNPVAGAFFVLSGIAVAVLCVEAMLAERQEFYRRGQLDGWMRGWRGQEPDVDDPLMR